MAEQKCKWLSDDFSEVCVNVDCPLCADFCPVTNYPEICKFAEMGGQKQTNGDRLRSMTDEEMAHYFSEQPDTCPGRPGCAGKNCYDCWLDWLKQEVSDNG